MAWNLLLERDELGSSLPSEGALRLLRENKLAGLIFSRNTKVLQGSDFAVDWKSQWLRSNLFLRELQILDEVWATKEIPATVLKGSALIGDIYLDSGQRSMCDIDLLIPEAKLAEAVEALELRGFQPQQSKSWAANEFKVVLEKNEKGIPVVLELHTRLFYQNDSYEAWSLRPHPSFAHLTTLTIEDQLIHLMGHLGYQHTYLMLHWFVDIHLFLKKYGSQIDCARVCERLHRLGQVRSAQILLWTLERFFSTSIPMDLPVPSPLLSFTLEALITDEFLWSTNKAKWSYFILKHLTKDRLQDSLVYDFKWLAKGGNDAHR